MDKELIGRRIKSRRTDLEMTQGDIAAAIGVAISTVQRYEAGTITKMKLPVVEAIARALQVNPLWLIGKSAQSEPPSARTAPSARAVITFPVVPETAAAQPIPSLAVWQGETLELPPTLLTGHAPSDFLVLSVVGDAMYPLYQNGDSVVILRQNTLEHSGDVALVQLEDAQTVLRRVDYVAGKNWMRLVCIHPDFPAKTLEGTALAHCRILGVPRLLLRKF